MLIGEWLWRTEPNDNTMVASVFQFLKGWPSHGGPSGLKTIALFTCDNLFCQDNRKVATNLAAKSGFKIVQRLPSADPDVFFFVQYPAETTESQADAKCAGFIPKVIAASNGAYSDQTWLTA